MQTAPGQHRRSVDVAELKARAEELVAEVQTSGERIEITSDGQTVAEIRPVAEYAVTPTTPEQRKEAMEAWLREGEKLAAEIGKSRPKRRIGTGRH